MKTTIERELKFEADDIQIDRLGGEPLEPHTFASSYHDTADRGSCAPGSRCAAVSRTG